MQEYYSVLVPGLVEQVFCADCLSPYTGQYKPKKKEKKRSVRKTDETQKHE
jgi:hypothetical protein